jgi:hypothetical protein
LSWGLFENESKANGVRVNVVSCWTTPQDLVTALGKESGRAVGLQIVSPEEFAEDFPDNLSAELTETLRIIGEYSFYGKGQDAKQDEPNKWLVRGGGQPVSLEEWIHQQTPWTFEAIGFLELLAEQKKNQT